MSLRGYRVDGLGEPLVTGEYDLRPRAARRSIA